MTQLKVLVGSSAVRNCLKTTTERAGAASVAQRLQHVSKHSTAHVNRNNL